MGSIDIGNSRGGGPDHSGLVGYKYDLGCVQVSSDHSPDIMRLFALLLMVGAAGKDTEIHSCTWIYTVLAKRLDTLSHSSEWDYVSRLLI